MSHYIVAVLVKDVDEVDEALAPFDENLRADPYINLTKEQLMEAYREYLVKHKGITASEAVSNLQGDTGLIGEYVKILTSTPSFETIKEWAKDWYGKEDEDFDEEGNMYSTYNPKSKWDWYQIGGHWPNLLTLKDGTKADYARIGDIDFEAGEKDEEEIKALSEDWDTTIVGEGHYKPEYYIEHYGTKENYIKTCLKFHTYSVLKDGQWLEAGVIGWFASSAAERSKWDNEYFDMFLVIVDCHI